MHCLCGQRRTITAVLRSAPRKSSALRPGFAAP